MPSLATLTVFVAAALALLLVPGPAVFYIVTRSVSQGRRAGLISAIGIHTGSVIHVLGAAFGLSAVLASSAMAFAAIKYAGAAYLVWLGAQKLLGRGAALPEAETPPISSARLFVQGVVVQTLNPKTAMFFLALLPQFVDPRGSVALQILALGSCVIVLGFLSDGAYVLLAGALARRLRSSERVRRRLDRASGVIYLGLGAGAALTGHSTR
jgi:threonine/homoserine/homoserine lactone efflux protein